MSTTPPESAPAAGPPPIDLLRLFTIAYADLWARYRALVAVLERHGIVRMEEFETEVAAYSGDHLAELLDDGSRRFEMLADALRSAGPLSGPPQSPE